MCSQDMYWERGCIKEKASALLGNRKSTWGLVNWGPKGISSPGRQLPGKFSTSFSKWKVLELGSTVASLHPQLEAELVSVVDMILTLEAWKMQDWKSHEFFLHSFRELIRAGNVCQGQGPWEGALRSHCLEIRRGSLGYSDWRCQSCGVSAKACCIQRVGPAREKERGVAGNKAGWVEPPKLLKMNL